MAFLYKPKTKSGVLIKFPQVFQKILTINGAWPIKDDADDYKSKLYDVFGWIAFVNMTLINFCEIASFIANVTDVVRAARSFCTAITGLFVVLRTLYFRIFSKKFTMLLSTFSREIWIDGDKYPRSVQKCHQVMRPVFVYFILIFCSFISYIFLPFIVFYSTNQTLDSQDKRLPYEMVFPYDVQKGTNYIITYIFALHAGWLIISHFYAHDAILLLFVSYLCGQLQILHGDIVRLIPECHLEWQNRCGKTKNVDTDYEGHWETGRIKLLQNMYTKRLHQLAARHTQLINFCVQLNDLISFPLLLNAIISTFLVCFCGFQFLTSGTSSFGDFIMFSSFFLSVMLQLYVICTCGSLLITTSLETASFLYLCNWEGGKLSEGSPLVLLSTDMEVDLLSSKLPLWKSIKYYPTDNDFRNKLRFMIMRSQRPLELNAMNFGIISLETFATILSSSMSYFALLKNFLEEET